MYDLYRSTMRAVERFDTQDWMLVMICAVIIGFFCLRGFGSRSGY